MIKSLQNSASALNANQSRIDVTANNIAGVNTDAYKSERPNFADLMYQKMGDAGLPVKGSGNKPRNGSGARQVQVVRNFDQGALRETSRETDFAINGSGFFKVTMPDGGSAYTRYGNFMLNADRELVTEDGYKVFPEVILPEGSQEVSVNKNGKVKVKEADGTTSDLVDITLYKFVNPAALKSMGGNLFIADDQAGPEQEGIPGQDGFGEIVQKSLESSNVDLAVEMTDMLESQRAYQMNARALRTADEMWGMANNLRK